MRQHEPCVLPSRSPTHIRVPINLPMPYRAIREPVRASSY